MWNVSVLFFLSVISYAASNVSLRNATGARTDFWNWWKVEDSSFNQMAGIIDDDTPVCEFYNPPMPDFHKSGQRISMTKCYEYLWQLNTRHERDKRKKECTAYKTLDETQTRKKVVDHHLVSEYPHMAAIGWKAVEGTWIFKCGGALISPRFVLTAAQCTKSLHDSDVADPVPKIVRLGDKNILDVPFRGIKPKEVPIIEIIVSPSFSRSRKYNDIALLRLQRNIKFTKLIQAACLWSSFATEGLGSATVTNWGVMQTVGLQATRDLHVTAVKIIDSATCDRLLLRLCNRMWCGLEKDQVCAGKQDKILGRSDTCQGEAGSPLNAKIPVPTLVGSMHHVVGVTVMGVECTRARAPGIYTRVAAHIDWIEGIVWRQV